MQKQDVLRGVKIENENSTLLLQYDRLDALKWYLREQHFGR